LGLLGGVAQSLEITFGVAAATTTTTTTTTTIAGGASVDPVTPAFTG
jgi:hypothetical protein